MSCGAACQLEVLTAILAICIQLQAVGCSWHVAIGVLGRMIVSNLSTCVLLEISWRSRPLCHTGGCALILLSSAGSSWSVLDFAARACVEVASDPVLIQELIQKLIQKKIRFCIEDGLMV